MTKIGIIQEVSSRTVTTKFGPKPTYSFKMDEEWYKTGFKKLATAGASVQFEAKDGTYGKEVIDGTFTLISTPPPSTPTTGHSMSTKTYKVTGKEKEWVFPIPPLDWQRNVIRTTAIQSAIDYHFQIQTASASVEDVLNTARKFEAYAAGDLDQAAAEKVVNGT